MFMLKNRKLDIILLFFPFFLFFSDSLAFPKNAKELVVKRWSFLANGGYYTFDIFRPQTDPVLLEVTATNNKETSVWTLGYNRIFSVDKFEANPHSGDFTIHFKKLYTEQKGGYGPRIPLKVILYSHSKKVSIQWDESKQTILVGYNTDFTFGHYVPKDTVSLRVLEPSTIHPLTYEVYFKPKGIYFPFMKRSKQNTSWYSSSPAPPIDPVYKKEDLKLVEALKGNEEAVWKLLQEKDKPTINEFLALFPKGHLGNKNPFSKYKGYSDNLKIDVLKVLPEIIVQFEAAYPGAIWYALGRDIYLLGDALNAYYTFNQERGRVRRLHASHPSFDGENVDEVVRFMESNDFQFSDLTEETTPRIIFDITSYSKGMRYSQSSQLMRAAYRTMINNGIEPGLAFRKVNFISVSGGLSNVPIFPEFDFEGFFSNLQVDKNNDGPVKILKSESPNSMMYTEGWHGMYSRFKISGDQVVTEPGIPSSYRIRLHILGEQWTLAKYISSKEFKKQLQKQEKYYGIRVGSECKNILE